MSALNTSTLASWPITTSPSENVFEIWLINEIVYTSMTILVMVSPEVTLEVCILLP
jgi:hypothetical protein